MTSSSPRRVDLPEGIPVIVRSFVGKGKGKILNVSASGAYIASSMYLLPQARVRLQIVLREERRWIEADAVVVWENRGTVDRRDGLPPGYGVRFVEVSPETEKVLDTLLAAPELPEPEPELHVISSSEIHDFQGEEPKGPPFRLRRPVIQAKTPEGSPGVYVLSYDRVREARVGRSDENLREAITSFEGEYAYFYFETIESQDERYYRECELYHRLGGDNGQLDNTAHPAPPRGADILCPVCVAQRVR